MTKEHIEKVIRNNRVGFSAHQLFKEFETEQKQLREQLAAEREFWDACEVGYEQEIKELRQQLAAERERYEKLEKSVLDLSHPNFQMLRNDIIARDNWLAAEKLEVDERGRTIIHYKEQLACLLGNTTSPITKWDSIEGNKTQ